MSKYIFFIDKSGVINHVTRGAKSYDRDTIERACGNILQGVNHMRLEFEVPPLGGEVCKWRYNTIIVFVEKGQLAGFALTDLMRLINADSADGLIFAVGKKFFASYSKARVYAYDRGEVVTIHELVS